MQKYWKKCMALVLAGAMVASIPLTSLAETIEGLPDEPEAIQQEETIPSIEEPGGEFQAEEPPVEPVNEEPVNEEPVNQEPVNQEPISKGSVSPTTGSRLLADPAGQLLQLDVGTTFTVDGITYKVLPSGEANTVEVIDIDDGTTTATIPATVEYAPEDGTEPVSCTITQIGTGSAIAMTDVTTLETLAIEADGVSIEQAAFNGFTGLTAVTFQGGFSLDQQAFGNCSSLELVDLSKCTSMGTFVFGYCTELKTVTLPDDMTTISKEAFSGCSSLTTINLSKVNTIEAAAFLNATSLAAIDLSACQTIGAGAFKGCTQLAVTSIPEDSEVKTELELPEVTTVGASAFSGCTSLCKVSLPKATDVGGSAFSGCTNLDATISTMLITLGDTPAAPFTGIHSVNIQADSEYDLKNYEKNYATKLGTDCYKIGTLMKEQAPEITPGENWYAGLTQENDTVYYLEYTTLTPLATPATAVQSYLVQLKSTSGGKSAAMTFEDDINPLKLDVEINGYDEGTTYYVKVGDAEATSVTDNPAAVSISSITDNKSVLGPSVNIMLYNRDPAKSCEVTATATPEEGGSVDGAGYYEPETKVTLTATANEGYRFGSWSAEGITLTDEQKANPELIFDAPSDGDVAVTANFEKVYTLTTAVTPDKGPTSLPPGYICIGDEIIKGDKEYAANETVELSATTNPAYSYRFGSWSAEGITLEEDQTTKSPLTFTMPENDVNITADFVEAHRLTPKAAPEDAGTVTIEDATSYLYVAGDKITAKAEAEKGYRFDGWESEDVTLTEEQKANAELTFTMPDKNATLTANFKEANTLTVEAMPKDSGTMTIKDATPGNQYAEGDKITVTAEAKKGYRFTGWESKDVTVTEEQKTNAEFTFTMPGKDATLTANFERIYTLHATGVMPENSGRIEIEGGKTQYAAGETVKLKAIAAEDYRFTNWSTAMPLKDAQKTNPELTFTMPAEDAYLQAVFAETYTLNINTGEHGTVKTVEPDREDNQYIAGERVSITVVPKEGYALKDWTDKDGKQLASPSETLVFSMPKNDYEVNANFVPGVSVIIPDPDDPDAPEIKGGSMSITPAKSSYVPGEKVVLYADAEEGYEFTYWTIQEATTAKALRTTVTSEAVQESNPTENPCDYTIPDGAVSITPNFKKVESPTPTPTPTPTPDPTNPVNPDNGGTGTTGTDGTVTVNSNGINNAKTGDPFGLAALGAAALGAVGILFAKKRK